ncbi:MAG: lactate racemase domain-containing protein, partial [Rubripirellula sp.]|nr:lactate racemase domain-containing protein [Rubripirellula sp.]
VEIIRGVLRALDETEASAVEIVVGDEADDQTVAAIQHEIGERTRVIRHESSDRSSLRYLGADEDADPVYLNRRLVDADLVLPIATGRPLDAGVPQDISGIYPFFADSASRARQRRNTFASTHSDDETLAHATQACVWLGAQFMLCAIPDHAGQVGEVLVGTPDAVRKRLAAVQPVDAEYPPAAPLLIASLDGGTQQQTWSNVARGFSAATRYVAPGGTIVLWTNLHELPVGCLLELGGEDPVDFDARMDAPVDAENEFPAWDASNGVARIIQGVAADHRLLIRSNLEDEVIESVGLAAIANSDELNRLIGKAESCTALRAIQFAGTTADITELRDE